MCGLHTAGVSALRGEAHQRIETQLKTCIAHQFHNDTVIYTELAKSFKKMSSVYTYSHQH
jgi:hypothetical protein